MKLTVEKLLNCRDYTRNTDRCGSQRQFNFCACKYINNVLLNLLDVRSCKARLLDTFAIAVVLFDLYLSKSNRKPIEIPTHDCCCVTVDVVQRIEIHVHCRKTLATKRQRHVHILTIKTRCKGCTVAWSCHYNAIRFHVPFYV